MPKHRANLSSSASSSSGLSASFNTRKRKNAFLPLVFVVVFLIGCSAWLRLSHDDLCDATRFLLQQQQQDNHQSSSRQPKLADGCYHVFLDAGANIGLHSRFLYEPQQYPKALNAHKAFEEAFGTARDNRDICAFGFEPNPTHRKRQQALQEAYQAMGWRYYAIEAGLGDIEGDTISLYHNDLDPTNLNSEWGFSVVDRTGAGRKEVVPSIHFSKWIEKEILGRKMPDKVYGQYGPQHSHNDGQEGKVAMKLDIEGMEFLVAPSLIYSGVMCKAIDVIWGEFHATGHIPVRPPMDPITGQGELPEFPVDWKVPQLYFNTLWKAMKSINPADCRARWIDMFDVEDYVDDTFPYPTPPKTTAT